MQQKVFRGRSNLIPYMSSRCWRYLHEYKLALKLLKVSVDVNHLNSEEKQCLPRTTRARVIVGAPVV